MEFILASWEDVYKQVFLNELYPIDTEINDLLDYFTLAKNSFNRTALTREDNRIMFNDGTQVSLTHLRLNSLPPKVKITQVLQIEEYELEDRPEHF